MNGYKNFVSHIEDEMKWVKLLLKRYCLHTGLLNNMPEGEDSQAASRFAVTDHEIRSFLSVTSDDYVSNPDMLDLLIKQTRKNIDERMNFSKQNNIRLPLNDLREIFRLTESEYSAFVILLAPELDTSFERTISFAFNDFTRRRIDIGFLLDLLCRTVDERACMSSIFLSEGNLLKNGLVAAEDPPSERQQAFTGKTLRIPQRMVSFCLDHNMLDETASVRFLKPEKILPDLVIMQNTQKKLTDFLSGISGTRHSGLFLCGAQGSGKKTLVSLACAGSGKNVLATDFDRLLEDSMPLKDKMLVIRRELALQNAVLYIEDTITGRTLEENQKIRIGRLCESLSNFNVIIGSPEKPALLHEYLSGFAVEEIPFLTWTEREFLWKKFIPENVKIDESASISEVAYRFPLTAGGVKNAVSSAIANAQKRNPQNMAVTLDDMIEASRRQLTVNLSGLAQRIPLSFRWEDIVLPSEPVERLRELVTFARHRKHVFEKWGFIEKLPYGKGLSVLFSGPPGTGKTMAAGIIARQLGMDLFRIDLSSIISKYVGETEKNLARIFDEAQRGQTILLFDEADSLFAQRTEVKSSIDRYANLEVNYLLQRMEDFDGVTVLTTNFETSIDSAFKRRIRYRIQFPFPDKKARKLLWQSMFPKKAELSDDIDHGELADRYEMTGGHIKNAVIRAAFMAADRNSPITMADLIKASNLEYKEIGMIVRDAGPE